MTLFSDEDNEVWGDDVPAQELAVDDNPLFERIARQARRSFGHFWRMSNDG